jgi:probable HAF family extracellular repeat protein
VLVGGATAEAESHAFVWESGHIRDLGTLGGPNTTGIAIDNSGRVVGNSTLESGFGRAFFVDLGNCTR